MPPKKKTELTQEMCDTLRYDKYQADKAKNPKIKIKSPLSGIPLLQTSKVLTALLEECLKKFPPDTADTGEMTDMQLYNARQLVASTNADELSDTDVKNITRIFVKKAQNDPDVAKGLSNVTPATVDHTVRAFSQFQNNPSTPQNADNFLNSLARVFNNAPPRTCLKIAFILICITLLLSLSLFGFSRYVDSQNSLVMDDRGNTNAQGSDAMEAALARAKADEAKANADTAEHKAKQQFITQKVSTTGDGANQAGAVAFVAQTTLNAITSWTQNKANYQIAQNLASQNYPTALFLIGATYGDKLIKTGVPAIKNTAAQAMSLGDLAVTTLYDGRDYLIQYFEEEDDDEEERDEL